MIYRTIEQKLIMTFSRNFLKRQCDFQQNVSDFKSKKCTRIWGHNFLVMNIYILQNLQTAYCFTGSTSVYSFKNSKELLQDYEILPFNSAPVKQLKNWSSYSIINNTVRSCLKETTFQETTG